MDTVHALLSRASHFLSSDSSIGAGSPLVTQIEQSTAITGLDAISIIIATIIGYIGVIIMAYGAFSAAYNFLRTFPHKPRNLPIIRINLGKHLALGLEFLVGKDIVETVVQPTWDELGKLGVIILLRTIVTIFLAYELREVEEEIGLEEKQLNLQKDRTHLKST